MTDVVNKVWWIVEELPVISDPCTTINTTIRSNDRYGPYLWYSILSLSLDRVFGQYEGCCEEIEIIFEQNIMISIINRVEDLNYWYLSLANIHSVWKYTM